MAQEPIPTPVQLALPERLDMVRQMHSQIDAAVLMDFRAGTLLHISTTIDQPQEKLDAACALAARLYGASLPARQQATLVGPTEVLIVQRTDEGDDTAIAFFLSPEVSLESARALVRSLCNASVLSRNNGFDL